MEIPVNFDTCILCKKNKTGDPEHIIPKFLGGNIKARILCDVCNKSLGSKLIAKIKEDPSFFFAIEKLKSDIPDIYANFIEKEEFHGYSEDGSRVVLQRNGDRLFVKPQKRDGLLELDTSKASDFIKKHLKREGREESEVEEAIKQVY